MKTILVLTCLCFIGVSRVYGISQKVLQFTSYYNGNYDNKAQTQKAGDDHDLIEARIIPVDVICFRPDPVVFVEELVNKEIRLLILEVVKEGIEDTVSLNVYNFANYTKYKPGELNAENLLNISFADLTADPDCVASFRVAKDFVYGNVPQCLVTVNEKHPRFTSIHKCDSITATMPMFSWQTSPVEPTDLVRSGQRYPLINRPEGYVAPCDP